MLAAALAAGPCPLPVVAAGRRGSGRAPPWSTPSPCAAPACVPPARRRAGPGRPDAAGGRDGRRRPGPGRGAPARAARASTWSRPRPTAASTPCSSPAAGAATGCRPGASGSTGPLGLGRWDHGGRRQPRWSSTPTCRRPAASPWPSARAARRRGPAEPGPPRPRHRLRVGARVRARRRHPPGQLAGHRPPGPAHEQPVPGGPGPRRGLPGRRRPAHGRAARATAAASTPPSTRWPPWRWWPTRWATGAGPWPSTPRSAGGSPRRGGRPAVVEALFDLEPRRWTATTSWPSAPWAGPSGRSCWCSPTSSRGGGPAAGGRRARAGPPPRRGGGQRDRPRPGRHWCARRRRRRSTSTPPRWRSRCSPPGPRCRARLARAGAEVVEAAPDALLGRVRGRLPQGEEPGPAVTGAGAPSRHTSGPVERAPRPTARRPAPAPTADAGGRDEALHQAGQDQPGGGAEGQLDGGPRPPRPGPGPAGAGRVDQRPSHAQAGGAGHDDARQLQHAVGRDQLDEAPSRCRRAAAGRRARRSARR